MPRLGKEFVARQVVQEKEWPEKERRRRRQLGKLGDFRRAQRPRNAGARRVVREEGRLIARARIEDGQCGMPRLPAHRRRAQATAGGATTIVNCDVVSL